MANAPLHIDYYTDLLCIWAWISQPRINELEQEYGNRIVIQHHYLNIFGNTKKKIQRQWDSKGGIQAFAKHVQESAADYEDSPIHPDLWLKSPPVTSAGAHQYIKAVELAYDSEKAFQFAYRLRKAFFLEVLDISNFDLLNQILEEEKLINAHIHLKDTSALAELMADYNQAQLQNIKGSPSYILNDGRQTLYGNVGYRVLRANVEELLRQPQNEASWC